MNQKEEERQIPKKNYFLLGVIFLITIGLTWYLCDCYQVYSESQMEIPVIRGTLSEITTEELDHYIMENPTTVIYMCTSEDMNCRNFEKDVAKLIKQKEIQESIVYLNLSEANIEDFVENFNTTYPYKVKLTKEYPALVVFESGEIQNILQGSEKEPLTIKKATQFIEMNKIGE